MSKEAVELESQKAIREGEEAPEQKKEEKPEDGECECENEDDCDCEKVEESVEGEEFVADDEYGEDEFTDAEEDLTLADLFLIGDKEGIQRRVGEIASQRIASLLAQS